MLYEVGDFACDPSGTDMLLKELEATVAVFVLYVEVGFAFGD